VVEVEEVQITMHAETDVPAEHPDNRARCESANEDAQPADDRINEEAQSADDRTVDVVQRSLEMYYSQRAVRSSRATASEESAEPAAAFSQGSSPTATAKPLYWSEAMDIQLAKLVSANVFDFDAVSEALAAMAVAGRFEHDLPNEELAARLTSECCRLRWAHLDAQVCALLCEGAEAYSVDVRSVCAATELERATGGCDRTGDVVQDLCRRVHDWPCTRQPAHIRGSAVDVPKRSVFVSHSTVVLALHGGNPDMIVWPATQHTQTLLDVRFRLPRWMSTTQATTTRTALWCRCPVPSWSWSSTPTCMSSIETHTPLQCGVIRT